MRVVKQIACILLVSMTFSCTKYSEKIEKKALLIATQKFSTLNEVDRMFEIYDDSSYVFKEIINDLDYNKIEVFKGIVKINNDTIEFFPSRLKYNNAEKAILKNGFVEFIDVKQSNKLKIEKTTLSVKNNIDFNEFKDYAVFTLDSRFHTFLDEKNSLNYDLNKEELKKIDGIIKTEITKNDKLRSYDNYLKQLNASINKENEVIVFAHLFCKDDDLLERFQYFEISINDGGNCNVYIQLNLSTEKIEKINIAGVI